MLSIHIFFNVQYFCVFQTREQILQERVQNIDNLEKKYDKLVTQKRKVSGANI